MCVAARRSKEGANEACRRPYHSSSKNMNELLKMGKFTGINSELAIPADTGTIWQWMTRKKLGMSQMKILVFGEADHMLAETDLAKQSKKPDFQSLSSTDAEASLRHS